MGRKQPEAVLGPALASNGGFCAGGGGFLQGHGLENPKQEQAWKEHDGKP